MSLEHPTPREGLLIVALLALAGCGESPTSDLFPYEGPPILDSLPQEGKADPSPAKREGRASAGEARASKRTGVVFIPTVASPSIGGRVVVKSPALTFTVWGKVPSVVKVQEPRRYPGSPNSKSRHAKSLASAGSQDKAVTPSGGTLAKPELHKLYAETCRLYKIKWSASESEAFVRVVWKESRGNPRMQNSRSSSAGLFGFLKSTRKNYGVTLSDPLEEQSAAFVRYCVNRYGSIRGALDFHRRHRYY